MALSVDDQKASYPLPAYNFRVTIGDQSVSFAKVSGLQREHYSVVYRHGLSAFEGETLFKYFINKWIDLTLERGLVPASAAWLYAWLESNDSRPMTIDLCGADTMPVIRWKIADAVAIKLSAPTFDASSSEVVIESLAVKAAGITIEEAP
ncbi:phage tail protein [Pseudenhygromyxa sp. WMMC2535]|uniref:phage tail protein n=1 Tax=Pseudenhygromyxa sp. WMMC2535 TaxID=2712867 RepID=UPI0015526EA5|nr:phage tail protein [Pseudenhygromyxa sp. WMMC2535]NVB43282.1 phage tail protein [Pseudenhygromyxa sp. WMMC2535]